MGRYLVILSLILLGCQKIDLTTTEEEKDPKTSVLPSGGDDESTSTFIEYQILKTDSGYLMITEVLATGYLPDLIKVSIPRNYRIPSKSEAKDITKHGSSIPGDISMRYICRDFDGSWYTYNLVGGTVIKAGTKVTYGLRAVRMKYFTEITVDEFWKDPVELVTK